MTPGIIAIILGSALLHAIWNAIIKGGGNKLFETAMKAGAGTLLSIPALLLLPAPLPASHPWIAATVGIHFFYYLFIAFAYKGGDFSYAYPLMRGSAPLFTALVSFFIMGETLAKNGWMGVGLLSSGILLLTLDCVRCGRFSKAATIPALANAAVIMAYTVVDGAGVRVSAHAVSYVCWVFFLNGFPLTLFILARHGKTYLSYVESRWAYGLTGGACSCVAYGLVVWAMNSAPVALVAALRETSVVFGTLLAVIFLKEKMTAPRIAAVLLVAAGAIAMRMG